MAENFATTQKLFITENMSCAKTSDQSFNRSFSTICTTSSVSKLRGGRRQAKQNSKTGAFQSNKNLICLDDLRPLVITMGILHCASAAVRVKQNNLKEQDVSDEH